MMRIYKFLLAVVLLITICQLNCYSSSDETITITTYYPSPYGSYNQLHVGSGTTQSAVLDVEGGTATAGNGLPINLYAQSGFAGSNNGGNIILIPGTATGAGTPGYVGIGTASPSGKLDVLAGAARSGTHGNTPSFYVTGTMIDGTTGPQANDIEFRHDNGTQGIGFGYNTIYQTGSNANNPLNLLSRGSSPITLNAYTYSTGKVGIGTVSPNQALEVNGRIRMDTWTADGTTLVYKNGSGDIGIISSDIRLKKNITPIVNALDIIKNISGIKYNAINEENNKQKSLGVIAQQVMKVLPEAVFSFKDDKGKEYFGVHYEKLTAVLIEAIKEQQGQIESQQKVIGEQKDSIKALNKRVDALEKDIKELKK